MIAVIQAGGKGTRLRPYTMVLPKPLMPVGSQPVLELLLKWLRKNGTHDVYITTGHLGHLIRTVCGDGQQWDLNIRYTEETQPVGTIGALTLLKGKINSTFLVINGDVLTDLSIKAFTEFHRQHNGWLSIAVARRNVKIDFGVIEQQSNIVTKFIEKPLLCQLVSTGVYCFEPDVLDLIPNGIPFGFDDLMHCMLGKKLPVHTFLHNGLWLDIGRVEDFHQAQELAWDELTPSVEMVVAQTAICLDRGASAGIGSRQEMMMLLVSEPRLGEEEKFALMRVIDSRWITMGDQVRAFERTFADYHGVNDAVAVSSCTAGLHLTMRALGIGPGDEVLVPALTAR